MIRVHRCLRCVRFRDEDGRHSKTEQERYNGTGFQHGDTPRALMLVGSEIGSTKRLYQSQMFPHAGFEATPIIQ